MVSNAPKILLKIYKVFRRFTKEKRVSYLEFFYLVSDYETFHLNAYLYSVISTKIQEIICALSANVNVFLLFVNGSNAHCIKCGFTMTIFTLFYT